MYYNKPLQLYYNDSIMFTYPDSDFAKSPLSHRHDLQNLSFALFCYLALPDPVHASWNL